MGFADFSQPYHCPPASDHIRLAQRAIENGDRVFAAIFGSRVVGGELTGQADQAEDLPRLQCRTGGDIDGFAGNGARRFGQEKFACMHRLSLNTHRLAPVAGRD
ncbi:hypothetical protein D3C84_858590 [compost metagenome]